MVNTGIDTKDKEKIIALISALVPDAKIILFGSRARGKFSRSSDVDIALDAGRELPGIAINEIKDVLAGTDIMFTIDVLDLTHVADAMKESIAREGIVWKA